MAIQDTAVISVREPYATPILVGSKIFEYRKVALRPGIGTLYIHVCGEDPACVQGIAKVIGCIGGSPEALWQATAHRGSIRREDFLRYFKGADKAYAYALRGARRLNSPIPLKKLGLTKPPQGIAYVKGL